MKLTIAKLQRKVKNAIAEASKPCKCGRLEANAKRQGRLAAFKWVLKQLPKVKDGEQVKWARKIAASVKDAELRA